MTFDWILKLKNAHPGVKFRFFFLKFTTTKKTHKKTTETGLAMTACSVSLSCELELTIGTFFFVCFFIYFIFILFFVYSCCFCCSRDHTRPAYSTTDGCCLVLSCLSQPLKISVNHTRTIGSGGVPTDYRQAILSYGLVAAKAEIVRYRTTITNVLSCISQQSRCVKYLLLLHLVYNR